MQSCELTSIAYIGNDPVGSALMMRLLKAGYDVVVLDEDDERAQSLVDAGARRTFSVVETIEDASIVITMMDNPQEVEEVYMGEACIVDAALPGAYLVDMTTSMPRLAQEIAAIAAVNDLHALDAPIIGGRFGRQEEGVTITVGGERSDFEAVESLLSLFGLSIYQGAPGAGQSAKLASQIMLAGSLLGTVEMIAFAKQARIDLQTLLGTLEDTNVSGWMLDSAAPSILDEAYTTDYPVKRFIVELGVALAAADEMELTLPGVETAYQLFDLLTVIGGEGLSILALELIYEDEKTCARFGLDWTRAERGDGHGFLDDDYDDYGDCDGEHDCDCDDCDDDCGGHIHGSSSSHLGGFQPRRGGMRNGGVDLGGPILGSFFSPN